MKSVSILCAILACAGCVSYESEKPDSEKVCEPPCHEWEECIEGECIPPPCCPDAPEGVIKIEVFGTVYDITTMQGAQVALRPVTPMDAITNPNPPCISCGKRWESDANGNFYIGCFDVTEVAIGLVLMVDDRGWDGAAGTYFPSGSGVNFWNMNSGKTCVYDAKIFAVPSAMVAALDAETNVDSARFGFVLGIVMDASMNPVEGAVIKMSDGTDLAETIYPDTSFTTFEKTATPASGAFILPHTNFAVGIIEITAEKPGMSFSVEYAAPKAGFCYVVVIKAE